MHSNFLIELASYWRSISLFSLSVLTTYLRLTALGSPGSSTRLATDFLRHDWQAPLTLPHLILLILLILSHRWRSPIVITSSTYPFRPDLPSFPLCLFLIACCHCLLSSLPQYLTRSIYLYFNWGFELMFPFFLTPLYSLSLFIHSSFFFITVVNFL